jgi:hypothetical protein
MMRRESSVGHILIEASHVDASDASFAEARHKVDNFIDQFTAGAQEGMSGIFDLLDDAVAAASEHNRETGGRRGRKVDHLFREDKGRALPVEPPEEEVAEEQAGQRQGKGRAPPEEEVLLKEVEEDIAEGELGCTPEGMVCPAKGVIPMPDPKHPRWSKLLFAEDFVQCAVHMAGKKCISEGCKWNEVALKKLPQCLPREESMLVKIGWQGCGWFEGVHNAKPCLPFLKECDPVKCQKKQKDLGSFCLASEECAMNDQTSTEYSVKSQELTPPSVLQCVADTVHTTGGQQVSMSPEMSKCMKDSLPEQCNAAKIMTCALKITADGCKDTGFCSWTEATHCQTGEPRFRCVPSIETLLEMTDGSKDGGGSDAKAYLQKLVSCGEKGHCTKAMAAWDGTTIGSEGPKIEEEEVKDHASTQRPRTGLLLLLLVSPLALVHGRGMWAI